uniref:Uncharacterized protein n=1 Tax=Davidia involucrata TaxID=16924 RepID=A0A5B7BYQ3_DAVIN
MVILGNNGEREAVKSTAMGPERSKPMHNFTMPCMKWKNQRLFRCTKVNSNGEVSVLDRASQLKKDLIRRRREVELEKGRLRMERKSKAERDGDDGIEAIREKLMFDLRIEADKMKVAILCGGLEEESAAAAAPASGGSGSNGGGGKSLNVDKVRSESKSSRLRGVATAQTTTSSGGERKERAKFSVSISRLETEEDFMAMVGHRPPRRPKKRAKIVQKQLDSLFPGLWLTEIKPDFYKVLDGPNT